MTLKKFKSKCLLIKSIKRSHEICKLSDLTALRKGKTLPLKCVGFSCYSLPLISSFGVIVEEHPVQKFMTLKKINSTFLLIKRIHQICKVFYLTALRKGKALPRKRVGFSCYSLPPISFGVSVKGHPVLKFMTLEKFRCNLLLIKNIKRRHQICKISNQTALRKGEALPLKHIVVDLLKTN